LPRESSTSRAATSPASTVWNRKPAGDRYHRQLRQLPGHHQHQVVKLVARSVVHGQSGVGDHLLRRPLGREVAEHGAVDPADDRDPLGADDRDVHQVLGTARDAALLVLSSSPLELPAQCTMVSTPSTALSSPSPVARSPIMNSMPSRDSSLRRLSTRT